MDLFKKSKPAFKDSSLTVYQTVCEVLDDHNWNYTKDEENLGIDLSMRGDDMNLELRIYVDDKMDALVFLSFMPYRVAPKQRTLVAFAMNMINVRLLQGNFDISMKNGNVSFRCSSFFTGSIVSKQMVDHMLNVALSTSDDYNDKLFLIAKDKMTLDELDEYIENK